MKKTKIVVRNAPKAAQAQQEISMMKCGFSMLIILVKKLSPQLGGVFRDLQDYVSLIKIIDGETVLDFYLRTLNMSQEI